MSMVQIGRALINTNNVDSVEMFGSGIRLFISGKALLLEDISVDDLALALSIPDNSKWLEQARKYQEEAKKKAL